MFKKLLFLAVVLAGMLAQTGCASHNLRQESDDRKVLNANNTAALATLSTLKQIHDDCRARGWAQCDQEFGAALKQWCAVNNGAFGGGHPDCVLVLQGMRSSMNEDSEGIEEIQPVSYVYSSEDNRYRRYTPRSRGYYGYGYSNALVVPRTPLDAAMANQRANTAPDQFAACRNRVVDRPGNGCDVQTLMLCMTGRCR